MRILLVEDEMLVAMMLEDMLEELGHELAGTAGRLDEALRMANELNPDLAILDVNLSGRHTFPVAEVLQRRDIPFAFATGYGAALPEPWNLRPALQKPFLMADLANVISRAMAAV
jgi:CheY-like chemotaxis protein